VSKNFDQKNLKQKQHVDLIVKLFKSGFSFRFPGCSLFSINEPGNSILQPRRDQVALKVTEGPSAAQIEAIIDISHQLDF